MSMTIIERLRMTAEKDLHQDWYKRECREAADRIEVLETALRDLVAHADNCDDARVERMINQTPKRTEGYCGLSNKEWRQIKNVRTLLAQNT